MILQMNLYCQKCIKTSLCFCIIIVSWEICIRSVRSVFHYDTTTVLIEFMNSFHIVSGSSFSHSHLDPVSYQLLVQLSAPYNTIMGETTSIWLRCRPVSYVILFHIIVKPTFTRSGGQQRRTEYYMLLGKHGCNRLQKHKTMWSEVTSRD